MSYQEAIILHKVLTELHIGMLFLATMAGVAVVISSGRSGWGRIAQISDGAFVAAAACGTTFLVLSAVTGFLAWPWDRLWRTPMVYSKVTYATLALALWTAVISTRLRHGEETWRNKRLSIPVLAYSLFGFATTVLASSAGGHLGHGASLLDPLFSGIDPYKPLVLAPWLSAGIITSGLYLILRAFFRWEESMRKTAYAIMIGLFVVSAGLTKMLWRDERVIAAQAGHKGHAMPESGQTKAHPTGDKEMKGHEHTTPPEKSAPKSLKPAEGASVKILSPKEGQVFKSDQIPVHFQFVKGKRGHHLHAYVDGELMGMFQSEKGTLTGIQPGHHVLEVRVVAEDHQTELDATDRIRFVVK